MAQSRVDISPAISDSVVPTTCYMCACRCGIKVHLRDGSLRYIEGNPEHPVNHGVLCGKGSAGSQCGLVLASCRASRLARVLRTACTAAVAMREGPTDRFRPPVLEVKLVQAA